MFFRTCFWIILAALFFSNPSSRLYANLNNNSNNNKNNNKKKYISNSINSVTDSNNEYNYP